MTTIATDGRTMAGDGRMLRDDVIVSDNRTKVYQLDDGRIVGCAGGSEDGNAFRNWLVEGGKRPKPQTPPFSALVLSADGPTYFSEAGTGVPVSLPAAIGSGSDFAIGAMQAGSPPGCAVRIAALRDPFTGGDVIEKVLP